jgi:hypothetical protein
MKRERWTITRHKKEAWKFFSKWVKANDKNICYTCGRYAEGSAMHAGHFVTGASCPPSLYFDERNVRAQCYHCNVNLSGNWTSYFERMVREHGKDTVEELMNSRHKKGGEKWDKKDYEEI